MSVSRYNGDTPRGLEVFAMKKNAMNPHRLAVLAMMTAVVFAVNFPRIIIPLPTGETSFTLANIACVLSGMLLGPLGGLASGLGSALYDLTNPIFAPECWLTFLTKGAMGLAAGLVFCTPEQRETASYRRCLASSLVGCLTYYLLYFSKSLFYDNMLVGGLPFAAAALLLPLKIPASLFNAAAAIAAAYAGAGIYALTINPVFSSLMLFVINYRQNPLSVHLKPGKAAIGKVFSFSAYQFSFQLLNYFSRNLDKLLMGRYMSLSQLGYYDKSYRLMMLPLQNIAYVVSPVMHPIFSEMQNDLRKLADSYRKVVRLLALIGLPLSVVLWFTAQELVLIIFGDQWQPSVPVFRILALSVGIQIVMSTSGSIFQAANATRMLFFCGLFSAALNTAAICTGIFAFGTTQAVAWCICISFAINFIQCYHALFCLTLRTGWGAFWRSFLSPLLLSALVCLPLAAVEWLLPPMPMLVSLAAKGAAALAVWLLYIQLSGEYDLKGTALRLLSRKNR